MQKVKVKEWKKIMNKRDTQRQKKKQPHWNNNKKKLRNNKKNDSAGKSGISNSYINNNIAPSIQSKMERITKSNHQRSIIVGDFTTLLSVTN